MRGGVVAWIVAVILLAVGCTAPGGDGGDASAPEVRCPGSGRLCRPAPSGSVTCEADTCVASRDGERHADCDDSGRYATPLESDAQNCGACGFACATGVPCVRGACVGCPPGAAACDGACADLATSLDHCGACGARCAEAATCEGGRCVPFTCATGRTACARRCVDPATDPANCGACRRTCGRGERCQSRVCACEPGFRTCPGAPACGADVRHDAANCGRCGTRCNPGQMCEEGACVALACPTGMTLCTETCTDLMTSRANCGACGQACPNADLCVAGVCTTKDGRILCARTGRHADLANDPSNCGACGNLCYDGTVCRSGRCVTCPAPTRQCGNVCVDVHADPDHCGACYMTCSGDATCLGGFCVCPNGRHSCPGVTACTLDLRTDPTRCGACNVQCRATVRTDAACRAGACVCHEGSAECDGRAETPCETLTWDDPLNCGACGNVCAGGTLCVAGRCVAQVVRPMSPISALYVTSARPWLRWALPSGVDGARVQVCATRACERVEGQWDVVGDRMRLPFALAPGVHFWRLFARRGDRTDAEPGNAWEFFVSDGPLPGARAIPDVNGDGLEDHVRSGTSGGIWSLAVFLGRPGSVTTTSDQVIQGEAGEVLWVMDAMGDLNGDGYGDVAVSVTYQNGPSGRVGSSSWSKLYVYYGGLSGLAATPVGPVAGSSTDDYAVSDFGDQVTSATPLGDRDGDGFGDFFGEYRHQRNEGIFFLFGGRSPFMGLESEGGGSFCPHCFDSTIPADFDADGTSDVAVASAWTAPWDSDVSVAAVMTSGAGARMSPSDSRGLTRCGSRTFPVGAASDRAVLDANDDGYDDLRVVSRSERASVLYRGGPGGLTVDRCDVLPLSP